jgi:hypothetical protein
MLAPPLRHSVRLVRYLGAEDEREPGFQIAFWLASEVTPPSATTVTLLSWWAAMNPVMTGSIVLVSALLPSNACTISGNPPRP